MAVLEHVVLASGVCPEFCLCRFLCPAFPVSHFLCPFTFRLFWPSALAYAMYTIPMHKVPGCSCSWYCTASLGTNIGHENLQRVPARPTNVSTRWLVLFPARAAQANNTRCTSHGIHQSHKSMPRLVLNSQPGLRKRSNNTRCTSAGIHQAHESMLRPVLHSRPGLRKS